MRCQVKGQGLVNVLCGSCANIDYNTFHCFTVTVLWSIAVFIVNDSWVHIIIIVLIMLNQNQFLFSIFSLMMRAGL